MAKTLWLIKNANQPFALYKKASFSLQHFLLARSLALSTSFILIKTI